MLTHPKPARTRGRGFADGAVPCRHTRGLHSVAMGGTRTPCWNPPAASPQPHGMAWKARGGDAHQQAWAAEDLGEFGEGGRILRAACPKVAVRAGCHHPCWKGRSQSLCWKGGQGPPGWLQPTLRGAKPSWQTARGGVRLGSGEVLARVEGEHCARAVPSCTARRSCKGCSGGATRQGLALP